MVNGKHLKLAQELDDNLKFLQSKLKIALNNISAAREECRSTTKQIGELNAYIAETRS